LRFDTECRSVINEGLSEIIGPSPFHHRETRGNGTTIRDRREEATGTTALCRPRLTSIIVIRSRSMIVTTLRSSSCVPRFTPRLQSHDPRPPEQARRLLPGTCADRPDDDQGRPSPVRSARSRARNSCVAHAPCASERSAPQAPVTARGGPKGRRNPARGETPGIGRPALCTSTRKGCRRRFLRPFRPPERGWCRGPRDSPGAGLLRPCWPPKIGVVACATQL